MTKVISKDGTAIAYDRVGSGPALILVDGALCSRGFGPMPKLAERLGQHFTVYLYDRRGRGESGDTLPYSYEREIEDLAALVTEAGGSASAVGLSSGAALALEAAAHGVALRSVVAYEPPYVQQDKPDGPDHEAQLQRLLEAGERGDAVKYFMRDMVGAPGFVVLMMKLMPRAWAKLRAVAHTLPYDAAVMNRFRVPARRFGAVKVPSLVLHGSKTDPRLARAASAVAAAIPGAKQGTLKGQTHNVSPVVLAPVVQDFCLS
jgi:pimeloyl-ACP methyl ester carboxylesterase